MRKPAASSTRRLAAFIVAALLLVGVSATAVSAEPFAIRGSFTADFGDPDFLTLTGEGFAVVISSVLAPVSVRESFIGPFICGSCLAGDVVDLSARLLGLTVGINTVHPLSATIGGTEYQNITIAADMNFNAGTVVLAETQPRLARYNEPMNFDGTLKVFADSGSPLFDATLTGTGSAFALYDHGGFFGGSPEKFSLLAFAYNFNGTASPTPEPSTLLLLGSALVTLAGRRRLLRSRPWPDRRAAPSPAPSSSPESAGR